jgi:RND family efflux transporter MFP subunit
MREEIEKLKLEKSELEIKKSYKKRKLIYGFSIGLLVVIVLLLFLNRIFMPALNVEVSTVKYVYPSQAVTILNASGYVIAQRRAAVASKVTGLLTSINVEEGSRVKAGDIIARLENEDVMAEIKRTEANLLASYHNLEQAKAELQDATLSFNRNKELLDKDYISKAEFDSSEARYKKAIASVAQAEAIIKANEAALRGAKVAYEYTLIRAPFDGVVLTKNADVGDIVTPIGAAAEAKAAVVTIADLDSLQVEADVSESNIHMVRIGQPCEIQLDALPGKRFRGKVHMIVPTADKTKATLLVKIKFIDKDTRILPEMSAKVSFLSRELKDEEQVPLMGVNRNAIISEGERYFVYVVQNGKAVKKEVRIGRFFGDMVEILSGVKAEEMVIISPINKIKGGRRVKIEEK